MAGRTPPARADAGVEDDPALSWAAAPCETSTCCFNLLYRFVKSVPRERASQLLPLLVPVKRSEGERTAGRVRPVLVHDSVQSTLQVVPFGPVVLLVKLFILLLLILRHRLDERALALARGRKVDCGGWQMASCKLCRFVGVLKLHRASVLWGGSGKLEDNSDYDRVWRRGRGSLACALIMAL